MLTIYTGNIYKSIETLDVTFSFPENRRSPDEQLKWFDKHLKEFQTKDISIKTFSPYILNYLNLLIAKGDLKFDNIEVYEYFYDEEDETNDFTSLKVSDNKLNNLIDTRSFSEPISWIYSEYNKFKKS